jgi:tetratricopeptide (TPR) repeat protein
VLPAVVLAALVLLWVAAGWQRVPADRWVVRDSAWFRVQPRPLEPGWRWSPALLTSTYSYPRETSTTSFVVGADEGRLRDPSGRELAAGGILAWRVDESGLRRLARQAGADVDGGLLRPALRDALRQLLAEGTTAAVGRDTDVALARHLKPRLAAAGISLVSVHVAMVGEPSEVARWGGGEAGSPRGRVLLVGWDGADWTLLDPLLARGELPHLQSLLGRGARAKLKTVTPVLSPVVWTSVATGVRPENHGIIDFVATDPETGGRIPVTSNLRKVPALWNLVSQANLPVGIVAWWATWPAEPVKGYLVTDRIAYQLFGMGDRLPDSREGKTWPPELMDEIEGLVVQPAEITDQAVRPFADLPEDTTLLSTEDRALLEEFKTVLAATETYDAIALQLGERGRPALRSVYYEATDTAAHLFMSYRPPRLPDVSEAHLQMWGDTVDAVYRDLDRRLGRLLETVDPDTSVLLVSDHGFRSGANRPAADSRIGHGKAAEWHRKYGVLVLSGPAIRGGAEIREASVLDIAPTVLALLDLPIPAGMDGRVLEEALDPGFLRRHPLRRASSGAPGETSSGARPSTEDQDILQRLESLGYISPADVDRLGQDEVSAFNNRASLLLVQGQASEALEELERGLALAPGALPLRVNKARALRMLDRDDEALTILLGCLSDDPEAPGVENLVGNIFMDRGELDRAEEHFRSALSVVAVSLKNLLSMGLLAERRGRTAEALESYRQVAEIDPDSSEAFNNIGNLFRAQALQLRSAGDREAATVMFRRAEEAYEDGLAADPDFIGTYNNLALLYQDTGRHEEAMALYRRALERDPENAVVHNNLGSLYFTAGLLDEARRHFERAIAMDTGYAAAYNNLGAVLGRLGRADDELESYRKAVDLDPDYADGHHNLGLALARRGDLPGAEKALQRAIELQGDYLSALATLGDLYLRQARPGEAIPLFRRALEVNPSLFGIRNQLAEALLATGDLQGGIAELRRSLELQPEQPGVRQRLSELEN